MRNPEPRLAWVVLAVAVAVNLSLAAPVARAQSDNVQELINRIDRLQRELSTLQRAYYRGAKPPSAATGGAAAPGAGGAGPVDPRLAARQEVRLTQLETEIRTLTGRSEELQHAVGQIQERLTKLVSDVDLRLRALEENRAPAAAKQADGNPGATRAPPAASPSATASVGRAATVNPAPDAPPQSRGTIPGRPGARSAAATPTARPAAQPPATPKQEYDRAISLMLNDQNFAGAESAFKSFIERHPTNELTGNAYYWLGETYYVRKDFKQAAFTFADGYQRFPKAIKAPDNLLKLGMSLGQLGQAKEACTAFSRLLTNVPNLDNTLRSRVERQRQRYQCR